MTANAEPLLAPDRAPRRQLTMWHAMAVCVGMVIGAGIFVTTPLAAENVTSPTLLLALWAFCGAMSLAGAMCFAEMAAAFPDAGGDYFFLRKAYGRDVGFLFAWSRFAVIHTGSMALLAFALGDYLAEALQVGEQTSTGFAALAIVAIAAVNLFGIRIGAGTQVVLMGGVVAGLLAVTAAGAWVALGNAPQSGPLVAPDIRGSTTQIGAALVFIFLAYGGWSDAATLSAEMRDPERGMKRALIAGMTLVTLLYLAVNWALLRGLTSYGLAESSAPAADLMLLAFGRPGQILIVLVVALTSITSMNAILISGARTTYAAARDNGAMLATLSAWNVLRGTPSAAILAISGLALVLVAFGAYTRGGFATIVDFLAPVYWLFLTLSGIALFILRRRYPEARRPFRAPLYPWIPLAFIASSAYVLYSSLAYVKTGALVAMGVMLIGALLLLALRIRGRQTAETPVS